MSVFGKPENRRRSFKKGAGHRRVLMLNKYAGEPAGNSTRRMLRRLRLQTAYLQSEQPVYYPQDSEYTEELPFWQRTIRLCIGLFLLLPLSVVMVFALLQQLHHAAPVVGSFDFWQSVPVWYSILGMLVFATLKGFRVLDAMLMFLYVAGHELTHALTAWMCFGRVESVSVDLDGGYVDTDKDNLFISLSPYFVPLWMLLWMGLFFVANWIYPFDAYLAWFCAGFGFWWAFHIYWTLWVIPREQPDLLDNGVVLSFMIIMLANVASLVLVLRCFGVISLRGYAQDFVICANEIYTTYRDLFLWILERI